MKTLKNYILGTKRQLSNDNYILIEKLKLNKKSKAFEHKYHPKDRDELTSLLEQLLKERGKDADLNDIDVSQIKTFYDGGRGKSVFEGLDPHNIDISEWDVSNAENMYGMFYKCENFNSDLSKWDVSKVKDMRAMFYGCKYFNCDLSKWDVSKVENMYGMFYACASLKNKPSWYKE